MNSSRSRLERRMNDPLLAVLLLCRPKEVIMEAAESPSLYDRLGGVYSIATVVDEFIDRVMTDPRLNANPRVDEAYHRVSPAGFKYLVTEMVCWAAGGPQRYTAVPCVIRTRIC